MAAFKPKHLGYSKDGSSWEYELYDPNDPQEDDEYEYFDCEEDEKIYDIQYTNNYSTKKRKIVLSTNVAETSLTVPGIRYVIDPGTVRISRYSYRSKLQRLPIEPVSQASANQRKGRCGRVAEGICYRLYSEDDFISRPEFTDPEILRTNLASVILKMLDTGIGDVKQFKFLNSPENKLWNDGFKLLFELEAVDSSNKLTKLGKKLASIPADPRLAKMLLTAGKLNSLREVLLIVSALSIQDPRERPAEKQQAADQCHAVYKDPDSDFVAILNLWESFEEQRLELSNNQLKKYCQKVFLSFMRMREWREVHRQLFLFVKELGLKENTEAANYESIHKALLSGMLGNIGRHDEKREYLGARNRRFLLSPGSGLSKKKPKWMFSAEIVETQQVYARSNAKIEVEWVEALARHLIKKNWSEPTWQAKRAQVIAKERVTLYGLEIVSNRPVNYGNIDRDISREIFIRSGLIEGEYKTKDEAILGNRALIADLEAIEDRTRRKDVVVDDEVIYDLYKKVIPEHVVSGASFVKWRKNTIKNDVKENDPLLFSRDDLKRSDAEDFDPALFPDYLQNNGIKFPLAYKFDPGNKSDGVNVSVPISAIKQISADTLEKGIPGLLRDKCIQLIKNLPRTLRKNFVPVPDVVDKILPKIESDSGPLLETLSRELRFISGITVPIESWRTDLIEEYLRLNIQVLDESGKVISQGRDLVEVASKVKHKASNTAASVATNAEKMPSGKTWVFGNVLEEVEITEAGVKIAQYTALKDIVNEVEKIRCLDKNQAEKSTIDGLSRLMSFRVKEITSTFPKLIKEYKKLGLLYAPVGQAKVLYEDFTLAVIKHYFFDNNLPRNEVQFNQIYESKRGEFFEFAQDYAALVLKVLGELHELKKRLKGKVNLAVALPLSDLKAQLDRLVFNGFLTATPHHRLVELPRYLKAAGVRFDKMAREMGNERRFVPILNQWQEQYETRLKQHELQGVVDLQLEEFRWLIEEQRVSWYAQQLGTRETVSEKRLNKFWEGVSR